MTKSLPDRRRSLCASLAALLIAALPSMVLAQTTFDLGALMQLLGTIKAGEATFTESRRVEMLERSLQSSGTLSFESPDRFVRETLKPRQERIAVVGDVVTLSSGSRSRTVTLDSMPEAAVIFEAIRGTLTGNREALEQHFKASVSGSAQRWSLELVPRDALLREQVLSVRVSGVRSLVREMLVVMADGDRSVMTIEPVASASR